MSTRWFLALMATVASLALSTMSSASADDRSDCADGKGTFMTGTIIAGPKFATGKMQSRNGLSARLTHSLFWFKRDDDTSGDQFQVAVDNVFASGYDDAPCQVPKPLSDVKVGERIEMCGVKYPEGGGIHWVHTNCGKQGTADAPTGFFKIISSGETIGPNLEDNKEYCDLWP